MRWRLFKSWERPRVLKLASKMEFLPNGVKNQQSFGVKFGLGSSHDSRWVTQRLKTGVPVCSSGSRTETEITVRMRTSPDPQGPVESHLVPRWRCPGAARASGRTTQRETRNGGLTRCFQILGSVQVLVVRGQRLPTSVGPRSPGSQLRSWWREERGPLLERSLNLLPGFGTKCQV